MPPVFFANLILIVHVMFVAVVVASVPLIIIGGLRRWRWVSSPVFRFTHLVMIAFVAFESLTGITCPLTTLESSLRAGDSYSAEGFIATWLDRLLFYDFPSWVFTSIYVGFALLVAALFYWVPVKRRKANNFSSASGAADAASRAP